MNDITSRVIPTQMTALVADTHDGIKALRATRVPVPKPGKGQMLVRIHAAPCNPADVLYLEGRKSAR